jgi:hypothetical protein
VGAKYNTAKKNFVESEVKFDLWKKTELKVLHKSGTNDVALKFKTNSPFEIAIEHDVRPKVLSQIRPFSGRTGLCCDPATGLSPYSAVGESRVNCRTRD